MEGYTSEQEQIESIKRWWRQNGKAVILGVVIGVGAVVGTRMWFSYEQERGEIASSTYQQLLGDIAAEDAQAAQERGKRLMDQYQDTPYAAYAALALAKLDVDQDDLAGARGYLRWILDNVKSAELQHIARLRLARVMLAQGEAEVALALINGVDTEAFKASYDELQGDIYAAMDNDGAARSAYEAALETPVDPNQAERLQLKLDALNTDTTS